MLIQLASPPPKLTKCGCKLYKEKEKKTGRRKIQNNFLFQAIRPERRENCSRLLLQNPSGCECGTAAQEATICGWAWPRCGRANCSHPLRPAGHCCRDMCGAIVHIGCQLFYHQDTTIIGSCTKCTQRRASEIFFLFRIRIPPWHYFRSGFESGKL